MAGRWWEASACFRRALQIVDPQTSDLIVAECLLRLSRLTSRPENEALLSRLLALLDENPALRWPPRPLVLQELQRIGHFANQVPDQEWRALCLRTADALLELRAERTRLVPVIYEQAGLLECHGEFARAEALLIHAESLCRSQRLARSRVLRKIRIGILALRTRRGHWQGAAPAESARLTRAVAEYMAQGLDAAGALDHYAVHAIARNRRMSEIIVEVRLRTDRCYCCSAALCHLGMTPWFRRSLEFFKSRDLFTPPPAQLHVRWVVEAAAKGGARSVDRDGQPIPLYTMGPELEVYLDV